MFTSAKIVMLHITHVNLSDPYIHFLGSFENSNITKKLQYKHDKRLCFNGLSYLPFTFCVFFWRIQEKAVPLQRDSIENLSRSFPHMYVYAGCK